MQKDKVIYWFRNDLRLHDNQALIEAAKAGNVIPVFVFDVKNTKNTSLDFLKTDAFRAKFIVESVNSLKKSLKSLGTDLIIKIGNPENCIAELADAYKCTHVFASKSVTQEETNNEAQLSFLLKSKNVDVQLIWNSTLYHVKDLPFQISSLPTVFTDFRKQIERRTKVRPLARDPKKEDFVASSELEKTPALSLRVLKYTAPKASTKASYNSIGGENEALKRLEEYIWKSDSLKTYKETRNQLMGENFSTKFSAYLSIGSLSPRKVYEEIKKYEAEKIENDSTYWLVFELLWRDYFKFIALKFGIRLFKMSGIKHDMTKTWHQDSKAFEAWRNGQTGVPIVDAGMRELNETGFLSNRMRQIVCSFLVKDLKVVWWWGAQYFESKLIDYDVCSNWGNWNYLAGIGTDPREGRYFNPIKQSKKYDPDGNYLLTWVPELKGLPKEFLFEPWLSKTSQYPKPINGLFVKK